MSVDEGQENYGDFGNETGTGDEAANLEDELRVRKEKKRRRPSSRMADRLGDTELDGSKLDSDGDEPPRKKARHFKEWPRPFSDYSYSFNHSFTHLDVSTVLLLTMSPYTNDYVFLQKFSSSFQGNKVRVLQQHLTIKA
jgi:hypothetical protein